MDELRLLTWNVDGLNESQLGERMERLCLEIMIGGDLARAAAGHATAPMPHVLLLQEVVRVAHRAYFGPHLGAAGFTVWPDAPIPDREHYELVAVRAPWILENCERRPFTESPLARAGTLATIRHASSGRRALVITGHLESLRSGHDARLAQAREIAGWMREAGLPAAFAGDTNLREAEWQALEPELADLRDAFVALGSPKRARVTWRPEGEARAGFRFDRVWTTGSIEPREMKLRSVPRASDHAGVEVALTV